MQGDCHRPVSAYWRHTTNSYQAASVNKLHMIRSMLAFRKWVRREAHSKSRASNIDSLIRQYIVRSLSNARVTGDLRLAWSILRDSLFRIPGLAYDSAFRHHAIRLLGSPVIRPVKSLMHR